MGCRHLQVRDIVQPNNAKFGSSDNPYVPGKLALSFVLIPALCFQQCSRLTPKFSICPSQA
eukprot:43395-Amphidinium_carterae.1